MSQNHWNFYQKGLISNQPPYHTFTVDKNELFSQYNQALYIRWDSDFDSSQSRKYYHVVKDGACNIESLPRKTRNMVRKCLKCCEIKMVDCQYIIDNGGYDVYLSEYRRYERKGFRTKPKSKDKWSEGMREAAIRGQEFWTVSYGGDIVAYSICMRKELHVDLVTWKVDYDRFSNLYPSYGLVYSMCEYYLHQDGVSYVNDGGRSLTQHSSVQDFLIEKFGFRKAYTKLNAVFRWYLLLPLIVLSPFENLVKNIKLRSMIRLYKWSR